MASAIENTSRPQWCSCDIGVRKKPSEDRGPNAIIAMRQPQMTTTMGVRQPTAADRQLLVVSTYESPAANARGTYSVRRQVKNEYS